MAITLQVDASGVDMPSFTVMMVPVVSGKRDFLPGTKLTFLRGFPLKVFFFVMPSI